MIHQRFIPVSYLLHNFLEPTLNQFSSLYHELDNSDVLEVDQRIFNGESSFFRITDHLATLGTGTTAEDYIQSLSPDEAFLLYVGIQISFLHFHADTQLLPAIPVNRLFQNLFAYLQAGYLSFKKHCLKNHLSIWESIIDYEDSLYNCQVYDE